MSSRFLEKRIITIDDLVLGAEGMDGLDRGEGILSDCGSPRVNLELRRSISDER